MARSLLWSWWGGLLLLSSALALAQAPHIVRVDVDPSREINTLHRDATGGVAVALLCDPHETHQVPLAAIFQPSILVVSRRGAAGLQGPCVVEDVNEDGCADLRCPVSIPDLRLSCTDRHLILLAKTSDGSHVLGEDWVKPLGCDTDEGLPGVD